MNKKLICLLLVSLLLMVLLPCKPVAANGPTSGNLGDTVTWEFEDGTLTISGEGYMEGLSTNRHPEWYYLKDEITKVVVEEGVLKVGSRFCKDCVNLTQVQLPSTIKFLNPQCFMNCKSLESITIPSGVTSIGGSAFAGCTSLKTVTIPNSVDWMEPGIFAGCTKLETVTLSDKLDRLQYSMFKGCSSLTSITLPKKIKHISSSAFKECKNLKNVEILGNITYIDDYGFYNCKSLERIELPTTLQWLGESVFEGCWNIKEIRFKGDMPRVENNVFALGKHDTLICEISYPGSNKTWTVEKVEQLQKRYVFYAEFVPFGPQECEHQAVTVPGKKATCTQTGLTDGKYCSICDTLLKKQSAVAALGHDLATTTVTPTCTEPGYDLHQCSRCDYSETDNPTEAIGHAFGEWEIMKEPTEEEVGLSQRICLSCGEQQEQEIDMLAPLPTQPSTVPATTPHATDPASERPVTPATEDRIEAGVWVVLILLAVAGAIATVKVFVKRKP